MPAGKTKAKGKGGGGEKKKGAKAAEEKEEIVKLSKVFLKCYQQRCSATESTASPRICRELRNCIENEVALSKFVLETSQGVTPRPPLSSSRASRGSSRGPSRGPATSRGPSAATASATTASAAAAPSLSSATKSANGKDATSSGTKPPILLQPLVESWTNVKYAHIRCLHVWNIELQDDAMVSLALFFESVLGPNIKLLELRETKLSPWAVNRLSKSLLNSQLTVLNLDFNTIICSSLNKLCETLQLVVTLTSLSLNFCQLGPECGEALGVLTATSQIKELSLIGNHLECDGFNEFFRPLVSVADAHISVSEPLVKEDHRTANAETQQPLSQSQPQDSPPPVSPPAPPPMPPIAKLFLQDNCIDIHGECKDMDGVFSSVISMRTLKRYLLSSPLLEEVNLEGNWIGEGGAREIMLALQQRKETGLPPLKMSVSPRICPIIFTQIMELNPSSKKKKRGKGKKSKKKRK